MESGTSVDGHRDDFLLEDHMQVSTSTAVKEPTCNEFRVQGINCGMGEY